jgi:colanic acid/amylovoran biosynthesis glycosyltransferase
VKRIGITVVGLLLICFSCVYSSSRLLSKKKATCKQKYAKASSSAKKEGSLRILFVVDSFPHFDQPFILDQIAGVIERGHDVYIAAKSEVENTIILDVVDRYDLMQRTIFFGKSNPLKLLRHHVTIPHINTFDVICCQFGHIGADLIRFKRSVHGITAKIITCWRGAAKEATMKPYVYSDLFKHVDLFLPVCQFLKNDIINLGCDPNKIRVLYVGIDYDRYQHPRVVRMSETINIMSTCRLVEKKGIEYAIRAVASVAKIYPNVRYTIIGDGPLVKDLKALVVRLHMQDHIQFIGNQPHERIPILLSKADIFLSPSVTTKEGNQEGIANSLKEAMASGVLVIATDHAGTNELVEDDISGLLVPERDTQALVEKIIYLIAHPEIWDTMRSSARKEVQERFYLADSINQFIAIIEDICIH